MILRILFGLALLALLVTIIFSYKYFYEENYKILASILSLCLIFGFSIELNKLNLAFLAQVVIFSLSFILLMMPKIFIIPVVLACSVGIFFLNRKNILLVFLTYILFTGIQSIYMLLQQKESALKVLILVIGAIIFDSMSYFIGSMLGKRKIAKSISPAKTVEGFIGGCASYYVYYFSVNGIFELPWIFVQMPLLYFVGDLLKSKIKRVCSVKDFSNFFGPHGGFIDRFDSHVYSCIFLYLLS